MFKVRQGRLLGSNLETQDTSASMGNSKTQTKSSGYLGLPISLLRDTWKFLFLLILRLFPVSGNEQRQEIKVTAWFLCLLGIQVSQDPGLIFPDIASAVV